MKLTALTMNPEHGNAKHENVKLDHYGLRIDNDGIRFVIRLLANDNDKAAVLTFDNLEEFAKFQAAVNQLAQLSDVEKGARMSC